MWCALADHMTHSYIELLHNRHNIIMHAYVCIVRASVDALCRDGAGLISRERVQRGRLTRQGTTS